MVSPGERTPQDPSGEHLRTPRFTASHTVLPVRDGLHESIAHPAAGGEGRPDRANVARARIARLEKTAGPRPAPEPREPRRPSVKRVDEDEGQTPVADHGARHDLPRVAQAPKPTPGHGEKPGGRAGHADDKTVLDRSPPEGGRAEEARALRSSPARNAGDPLKADRARNPGKPRDPGRAGGAGRPERSGWPRGPDGADRPEGPRGPDRTPGGGLGERGGGDDLDGHAETVHLHWAPKGMGTSWRDILRWLRPSYVVEQEKLVQDLLDANDALHKDVDRLRRKNWRLEAALERVQGQSRAREEVQSQQIRALCDQARRCKCRS
jgi:hypothetical protein